MNNFNDLSVTVNILQQLPQQESNITQRILFIFMKIHVPQYFMTFYKMFQIFEFSE